MKDITIGGKTFSGVATIKVGDASFVESSETVNMTISVVNIESDLITESDGTVTKVIEKLIGSEASNGVYICKAENNALSSAKMQYGLVTMVIAKSSGSPACAYLTRNPTNPARVAEVSANTVAYLAAGASVKVVYLP